MPVLPSYRIQSSDLLCKPLTGFYMRAALTLNGLIESMTIQFRLFWKMTSALFVEHWFVKEDLVLLRKVFQNSVHIECYNATVVSCIKAFCICLKRYVYLCCCQDMISRFPRSVPELFIIIQDRIQKFSGEHTYLKQSLAFFLATTIVGCGEEKFESLMSQIL